MVLQLSQIISGLKAPNKSSQNLVLRRCCPQNDDPEELLQNLCAKEKDKF